MPGLIHVTSLGRGVARLGGCTMALLICLGVGAGHQLGRLDSPPNGLSSCGKLDQLPPLMVLVERVKAEAEIPLGS